MELPGGQKVAMPGKRERALLAYLALSPLGRQSRRKLAALLWGDATDETLLDNLRTCVWKLRKALGDTEHRILTSDDEELVLDIASFDIDVLAFRRLATKPGRSDLEVAATFCSQEFLAGLELNSDDFETWRRLEASRHLDQVMDVLSRLMKLSAEAGETERALEIGSQILVLDPLHEATVRQMMRLYAESGRRGAAIQLYKVLSEALQRDLNTLPEADTSQFFHALMQAGEASDLTPPWPPDKWDIATPSMAPDASVIAQRKPVWSVALASSLIVLIALASYWWISQRPRFAADNPDHATSIARMTAGSRPLAVAVLPFENLSGDPDQEFFSDGMTEEISSALSKVPGLELIARTSAFQFRGNKDARQVGRILGARYVLEGAVRKKGDRVRITAQLVRTDAGRLVWSDTYERQLTDIFAIQEDIAKAIASELRLSISLPAGENLVSSRDVDANAYEQFLRARPLVRARQTGVDQAIEILEPLVGRNPKFAPAWALLSQAYSMVVTHATPYTTIPGHPDILQRTVLIEKYWPKAEMAARQAIMLNSSVPEGYVALGQLMFFRGKFAMADDLFAKALAIDRYNPDALGLQMNLMADTGQTKKASQIAEELLALDPFVPTWKQDAAEVFWEAGQADKAVQLLTPIGERPSVPSSLAMIYAADGRFADAAKVLNDALKVRGEMLAVANPHKDSDYLVRFKQNQSTLWRDAVAVIQTAPAKWAAGRYRPILGRLDWAYLHVGAPEQALEHYESDVRTGLVGGAPAFGWVWHSSYAPARRTTQFKTLMKKAGFVDYWRERGWPELCRPLGSSDFECH